MSSFRNTHFETLGEHLKNLKIGDRKKTFWFRL